jgi:hypothetical protein
MQGHSNDGKYVPPETRGFYFRLHDSGDFFSRKYLEAWNEVARRLPDVKFWAPTRIWALPNGTDWVNDLNLSIGTDGQPNFIIRPSQYMINRPAPVPNEGDFGPNWAAWTTVYGEEVKWNTMADEGPFIEDGDPFNWDCQAYQVNEAAHNCRAARAPDLPEDEVGCRACWEYRGMSVNYTQH